MTTRNLSPREQELWKWLSAGYSNKQIAAAMGLSVATVRWYVTIIYQKLRVTGRVEATIAYMTRDNDPMDA
ncbi:response regulator transcription factor [Herpetosiphon geysericola]|uniref:HTH luxR-type domain-containing protein n=1 Tax=Herpetosiphon geysericola TaxID=70996 RepID=A0A0N8GQ91_9CHLR|nr:helix-turn-helix transcriptional regulator [Herpetosiphon geysericola]KPL83042.1 hypothetical protein SE18_19560 [Herpetosiphon geysericola]